MKKKNKHPQYKEINRTHLKFLLICGLSLFSVFACVLPMLIHYFRTREEMGAMIEIDNLISEVSKKEMAGEDTEMDEYPMYSREFIIRISDEGNIVGLSNYDNYKKYITENYDSFKDQFIYFKDNIRVFSRTVNNITYYGGFEQTNEILANNQQIVIIEAYLWGGYVVLMALILGLSFLMVKPLKEGVDKQNQFIGNVSHDLKTPLAIIRSNAELLREKNTDESENREISNIISETANMNGRIKDLMTMSEILSTDVDSTAIDISQITEKTILTYDAVFFENKIKFESDVDEGIIIKCHASDYKRILDNLITNSIRYADSRKEITLSLKKNKNNAVLRVFNTGCEITPEQKKQLFNRFFKSGDNANASGLGLSIVKSICEKYDFKIEVDTDLHESTAFKITFRNQ